jgi:hypothetical protein
MYPISAGIADTLSARSQCHLVELESRSISECAKSHPKVASAQSISSVAMVMMAGPAVMMAAAAAPSVVMSAPATTHMAVTMTVTALHLDDGIAVAAGKDVCGNGRHRQRRRCRGEHRRRDKACLNKTFHPEISSTAQCGEEHKCGGDILFPAHFGFPRGRGTIRPGPFFFANRVSCGELSGPSPLFEIENRSSVP